jgi:MFS family permease
VPAVGTGRRRAVFAALAAGQVLVSLDASVLNVAIRRVRTGLDASGLQMQAIVVSYLITFTALALPLAAWAKRVGTNRVFLGGCAVFAVGSAGSAAAVTPFMLIAARSVQGMGARRVAVLRS